LFGEDVSRQELSRSTTWVDRLETHRVRVRISVLRGRSSRDMAVMGVEMKTMIGKRFGDHEIIRQGAPPGHTRG
jgi:hypothetical protein